jgi:glycosyltransferase involved in cell wall biosynthesis
VEVVYYTHTAFFEPSLCLVRELSTRVAVHFLLELSAGAWQTAGFDVRPVALRPGLVPADDVLGNAVPDGVRAYWQAAASFHLVVHPSRRSLHAVSWKVSRQVLRFAADRRADVLHIDDVDVSPRLPIALPFAPAPPIVLSAHDPEPHSGERNWRKTLARRIAYPRASRFVLYNAAMRESFAARYGINQERVVTTKLGVYDVFREWATEPVDRDAPTVLFFGRIAPYKRLDVFYEAARIIAARVAGVRFVVAGRPVEGYSPPQPPHLDGAAVEVISRYLSNKEVARLFKSASVVVCPYHDATQSGVVLTAFAFEVPVIATRAGGLPEYVTQERTGLLVGIDDPQAVADAACRILLNADFMAQLRQHIATAAVGTLSWRATADALLHTYASVSAPR